MGIPQKFKGDLAKAGRYGGTYAYKDIAFEFASWVSPQFKGSSIARAFKAHSEQGVVFNPSSALLLSIRKK